MGLETKMAGIMAKQFLMAAGVREPELIAIVDALLEGGFEAPEFTPMDPSEPYVMREGSTAIKIVAQKPTDEFTVILIRRRKMLTSGKR